MILLFFILPGFIYCCALFFWGRYLYIHSLKKAADREYFLDKLLLLGLYLPVGLQAIVLFCYSLLQLIPLGKQLAGWVDAVFLKSTDDIPDFYPLKIVLAGFLLVTVSYWLVVKAALVKNTQLRIAAKTFAFAAGFILLKILQLHISDSFFDNAGSGAITVFKSNDILLPLLLAMAIPAFIKGAWIYKRQLELMKYFSLASKVLLLYIFLVLLAAMPGTLYLLVQK